jgi:hypothetical protein
LDESVVGDRNLNRLIAPRIVTLWSLAALVLTAASLAPASAVQQIKSLYTAIDLKKCKVVGRHEHGGAWLCEGLKNYPVYVAEGDLRIFLSVGAKGADMRAAQQTLGPFNSIFEGDTERTTVEWRFIIRKGQPIPYATIVRYFTQMDNVRGEVLVVMRVGPTEACHVAYIDALANADAIAMARRIADERARTFDCKSEPEIKGARGRSPM